jgi:hypothetical protein
VMGETQNPNTTWVNLKGFLHQNTK